MEDFDLPEVVIATIVSFTVHPAEPQFQMLRQLTVPVRRAVDKLPKLFNTDRVLLIESSNPELHGPWYFSSLESTRAHLPGGNLLRDDMLASVERSLRDQKQYVFTRENHKLTLSTIFFDANELPNIENIPESVRQAGELALDITRDGDQPKELGRLFLQSQFAVYGKSYAIHKQEFLSDAPSLEGLNNPLEMLETVNAYIRTEMERIAQEYPEHAIAPENIPMHPTEGLQMLLDMQWKQQQKSRAPIRICVLWPGHSGEL